jgi:hypothetical protein
VNYEELKRRIQELCDLGLIDRWPSREQRIDWAFGQAAIENPAITREMVARALNEVSP